jgi:hypothetical protein
LEVEEEDKGLIKVAADGPNPPNQDKLLLLINIFSS